jgi:copper(I)-binding protein
MRKIIWALCGLLALPVIAEEMKEKNGLQIKNAYARASIPGQNASSVFLTMSNPLDQSITLMDIKTRSAKTVELHTHTLQNGQLRMRKMPGLTLAAHGSADFKPGAQHIMLIGLTEPLQENTQITLEICFDKLCSKVDVPVISVLNEHAAQKDNQ